MLFVIMSELENLLKEIYEKRCQGGYEAYRAERKGSMKIGMNLFKDGKVGSLSEGMKEGWRIVKENRLKPSSKIT